jgi:CspA family cold shock protein
MTTGTVKMVAADRGYGFITADDGRDYFFHRSAVVPPLDFDRIAGGEKVQFDVESGPKGPRARNVAGQAVPAGADAEATDTSTPLASGR